MAISLLRNYEAKLSRGMLLFASYLELITSRDSMRSLPLYENTVYSSLNSVDHHSTFHLMNDFLVCHSAGIQRSILFIPA